MNRKIFPKIPTISLFTDSLYGCIHTFRVSVLSQYFDDDLTILNFTYQCRNTYWKQLIPHTLILEPYV